jgi:hypothetical protein
MEITTSNGFPTASLMIVGQADDETLRQQARRIKSDLERIKGVDQVFASGLRDPEILIRPDAQALATRGLLMSDVADSLNAWWRDTSGGSLKTQDGAWSVGIEGIETDPQALAQCRHWLALHMGQVKLVEVASTAEGARRASVEKGAAALASPWAAQIYRLVVRQRDVQDRSGNSTRFYLLGQEPARATGKDKTSLLFTLPHRAGALHRALGVLAAKGLNLLKVESRPAPGKPWEYVFFVDVRGHIDRPDFHRALQKLEKQTQDLRILGSYPEER